MSQREREYDESAEDITAELETSHILILSRCDPKLADELTQTQFESGVTLSFDLRASQVRTSDDIGPSQHLQEHLLARGVSSPISAYTYYLGFLEHVFHASARILNRLKEESGTANGALELWSAEMADSYSNCELQRTIVRAHANAIRVRIYSSSSLNERA